MKKFNADGGFRKDSLKEFDEHNLNNYSGQSLEEATEALDDTILLSEEEVNKINEHLTDIMDNKKSLDDNNKRITDDMIDKGMSYEDAERNVRLGDIMDGKTNSDDTVIYR